MKTRTYRANSIQAALDLVRRDLGPEAAVLHSQQVRSGLVSWLTGRRQVDVVASDDVNVPSRLPPDFEANSGSVTPTADTLDFRRQYESDVKKQLANLNSLVEQLCERDDGSPQSELPDAFFQLFTDLIEAGVTQDLARDLIKQLQQTTDPAEAQDVNLLKARAVRFLEKDIPITGPIHVETGKTRLVALVGPTGVGKTTTIAKLAANYRLREKKRVGLITVDTYRIAAVDQLRTYADIIDLPMQVVSSPREMREAIMQLNGLDLILMDTAGRSPRDEIKIQELKSLLSEAKADEVHLVLSTAASAESLTKTAERFSEVGTTTLILT
ncbi:MAG: flagellar biosynthesis protein FlhF, partial [Planctomycetaceae bacterium]|nr:flagellar biosynthesis protein FlhF [Planctomycetaceae bacterium]